MRLKQEYVWRIMDLQKTIIDDLVEDDFECPLNSDEDTIIEDVLELLMKTAKYQRDMQKLDEQLFHLLHDSVK